MIRDVLGQLFALRPSPVRWPIGLQAGIAVGVPVAVFALAGYENLGIMAAMGAFVSLYAASISRVRRAAVLPFVVLGILVSALLGVLTSHSFVLGLATLVVVAALAAALSFGMQLGPPGPIFFVLIAGVSGYLAAPAELGGVARDPAVIVGMVAVGCVFAYLVVLAPLAAPRVWRRELARFRDERTHVSFRFAPDEPSTRIVVRIAVAAALAAIVSAPLGVERAYWVVVTAVAILQNFVQLRLTAVRAAHRLLGTLLGIGVYAVIALLHPSGVWLAIVLAALQFTVELLVTRNYGLALALITPLALIISTYGNDDAVGEVVRERTLDTLIGSVIAVAVLLLAWGARGIRSAKLSRLPSNGRG